MAFRNVVNLAEDAGISAYLVGGPVRDALLGTPALDLDFSVEGDAIALANRLARLLGGRATAHHRFGTATVATADCRVDLVSARKEAYPRPGQLPEVTTGDIHDDLLRRDFSINAMAIRVSGGVEELLDPAGGMEDLEARVIRALHRNSFIDDPTRMFRAVRYEQRFGFRIDDATLDWMRDAIVAGHMNAVSGDRWRHEIERILQEAHAGRMLLRAAGLGLLAGLHPALGDGPGIGALARHPEGVAEPDEWVAAMFHPLSPRDAEAVLNRLRLSGRRAALARDTIELKRIGPQVAASLSMPSCLHGLLSGLDPLAVGLHAKLEPEGPLREALRRYLNELRFVRPGVTGAELLGMGAGQGPAVGRILARLREARLDGAVSAGAEERALARALVARSLDGDTEGK